MIVRIHPVQDDGSKTNSFSLPPDKSILHRLLILGSLTHSSITVPIPSPQSISHDVIATVLALEALGASIEIFDDRLEIQGVGMHGLHEPNHRINCANSGTTARLLMGLLAGQQFHSILTGDDSLSKRPMQRLASILNDQMGAKIDTNTSGTLPVTVSGTSLHGGSITLPVASAQMKSALLLASLYASEATTVREPLQTRDHTEIMLALFGAECVVENDEIRLQPVQSLEGPDEFVYNVPGDFSSACFLIAAAVLMRKDIRITNVGLNPTRTRFLELLAVLGIETELNDITEEHGEERGTIQVFGTQYDQLLPFEIDYDDASQVIDELPIFMLLAAFANGESAIRGAKELRIKESDRIGVVARQFERFGIAVTEHDDGLTIYGDPNRIIQSAKVEHAGDHRLAMIFTIAALRSEEMIEIPNAEVCRISYPDFFIHLQDIVGSARLEIVAANANV